MNLRSVSPLRRKRHDVPMTYRHVWFLVFCGMICVFFAGCPSPRDRARDARRTEKDAPKAKIEQDHIADAWGYLAQLAELNEGAAADQIMFHLNSWLEQSAPNPDWKEPKKLIGLLSERHKQLCATLSDRQFPLSDLNHLRTCYMGKRISEWSTDGPRLDRITDAWIEQKKEELSPDDWRILDRSVRLFDWVVRNVRLEELSPPAQNPQPRVMPEGLVYLGPGYRQTVYETIWHGTGDAWQRSRVFLHLCRQMDIDACLIAPLENTPWRACGVRIGKELFLFDPALGLPIPGPGQVGIASLSQAKADASILRRMNVPGWFDDYPATKETLKEIVCLMDAPPESLSWRMAALESSLTGNARLKLTMDVEALSQRLSECSGVTSTGLWSVSFDAPIYQDAMEFARREDPALNQQFLLNWGMVQSGTRLAIARWQHMLGNLQGDDEKKGALVGYQAARMTDKDIDQIRVDVQLQIANGVRRTEGESSEQFAFKISTTQQILRVTKLAASFWLGEMLIDDQRFETAANWLGPRFLESGGAGGLWEPQAQYCVARTLEQQGKAAEAIEIYRTPKGSKEQQHANRLRARLLERLDAEAKSDGEESK